MAHLMFFYGSMNSGKSTALLQTNYDYTQAGFKPLIIKPKTDTRDGVQDGWGTIKSRLIDDNISCYYMDSIVEDRLFYTIGKCGYNLILVDEVQFFRDDDIWALSNVVDNLNIPVFCYGIKTDSNGHLFDGVKQLLAIADEIVEIKHICSCGQENANMHIRYINGVPCIDGDVIAIDGKDKVEYKSVCRKCWKKIIGNLDK